MIHFDMKLEDFKGKTGFNQKRDKICRDHNQELVLRSQQEFLSSKEFNKSKLAPPPIYPISPDEIIFRDFNSNII